MTDYSPRFAIGDHVASNSGLVYVVLAINELDQCGSRSYTCRRLRAGVQYGPTREIAECGLWEEDRSRD
jgi:hypothetical protein